MTFADALAQVKSQGGFDVSDTEAKAEINERYRIFVSRTKWRKAQVSIGTTVIGRAEYALASNIVDLEGVLVGSTPYERTGQKTLWDLKSGRSRVRGSGGVYAPDFSSGGDVQIELYPAPTTAGDAITGLASITPVDLTNPTDEPIIPADFHQVCMVDGPVASFLARVDERVDQAPYYEQRYVEAIEACRRRMNSRVGSGPVQIQVAGKHF